MLSILFSFVCSLPSSPNLSGFLTLDLSKCHDLEDNFLESAAILVLEHAARPDC